VHGKAASASLQILWLNRWT